MRFSLSFLGVLSLIVSMLRAEGGPPPSPVKVARVELESVQKRVRVNGQVYSRAQASLSPRVDGYALKVHVNEGQRVKKGELLANIDDRDLSLQKKVLQASLAENEAELGQWEKLRNLQKAELVDLQNAEKQLAGTVSRSNLRNAEKSAVESEGMVNNLLAHNKNILAQIEQVEQQLAYTQLLAPFDGQVLDKKLTQGQWLRRGEAVLTLLCTEDLEVRLDCPASLLGLSDNIMASSLVFASSDDQSVQIGPGVKSQRVDPLSRSFQWTAPLMAGKNNVCHGSAVFAQVPTSEKEELLWIPTDAVLKNDAGAFVYKVLAGPAGKMVLPRPIQVIYRQDGKAFIQRGALQIDDQVVIEGNERLFPMTPVQVLGE